MKGIETTDRAASRRAVIARFAKGKRGNRITEDDPRWNPATMGDKTWGPGYRGTLNYPVKKGRGAGQ